ncbi:MAG: hypothetical protein K2V38_21880 [Gemmataceae bacterium]|nr:hypothetical protein [Gemmataceae bacterium]
MDPQVVNKPTHAGQPGTEGVSASQLGPFAKLLPKKWRRRTTQLSSPASGC